MNQDRGYEYIHSWYLFLMTCFSLIFLLVSGDLVADFILVILIFYFYFKNGMQLARFRQYLLYTFIFSFFFFLLGILYPAKSLMTGGSYNFLGSSIYEGVVKKSLSTMVRLFLVSFVSMSGTAVINYTKVILYLIVHKRFKIIWGYPLLLALNSIALFKSELERIRINANFRGLPWYDQFFVFFPFLVFAIRHSERGALALLTRGLDEKKTFYFSYNTSDVDRYRFKLFFGIYLFLVIFNYLAK